MTAEGKWEMFRQGRLSILMLILGVSMASLIWGAGSARAVSVGTAVIVTPADVGTKFKVSWSQSLGGGLPDLVATSVWTILGFNNNSLTLGISLTNATADTSTFHSAVTSFGAGVTPNANGTFTAGGAGGVFKTVSAGHGPQQTFPGGFKGIDLCISSSGCSGGSFQKGLHAGVTDIMSVILLAAFGDQPEAALLFFPLKFQTSNGSYELAGQVSTVPLPATLPLLATAIAGLGAWRKRRAKPTARTAMA